MSFWKRAKELYFNLKTTKASLYLSQPKMAMICPNSGHSRMFSAHDLWTANVCSTRDHNTPENQTDILNMKSLRGNYIIQFVPYTSKSSLVIVNVIERLFSRQISFSVNEKLTTPSSQISMEPRQVTKQHGIEKGIRPIKPGNELSHIPWNIFEEFRRFPKVTDSIAATAQLSCIRLYLL